MKKYYFAKYRLVMPSVLGPREAICVISIWIVVISGLMAAGGFINSTFFEFGPSPSIYFFKTPIDTWFKWGGLAVYVILNQIFTTYGLQTISPWMIHSVENRAVKMVNMPDWQALSVIEIWYMYMWVGRVISIQILLIQIDFLLMILVVDLIITFIINKKYLNDKHAWCSYLLPR